MLELHQKKKTNQIWWSTQNRKQYKKRYHMIEKTTILYSIPLQFINEFAHIVTMMMVCCFSSAAHQSMIGTIFFKTTNMQFSANCMHAHDTSRNRCSSKTPNYPWPVFRQDHECLFVCMCLCVGNFPFHSNWSWSIAVNAITYYPIVKLSKVLCKSHIDVNRTCKIPKICLLHHNQLLWMVYVCAKCKVMESKIEFSMKIEFCKIWWNLLIEFIDLHFK